MTSDSVPHDAVLKVFTSSVDVNCDKDTIRRHEAGFSKQTALQTYKMKASQFRYFLVRYIPLLSMQMRELVIRIRRRQQFPHNSVPPGRCIALSSAR